MLTALRDSWSQCILTCPWPLDDATGMESSLLPWGEQPGSWQQLWSPWAGHSCGLQLSNASSCPKPLLLGLASQNLTLRPRL